MRVDHFDYELPPEFFAHISGFLDRDGNGVVDLGELFSGMSLLCAGNAGDKLKAACYVFDDSGDGRIFASI